MAFVNQSVLVWDHFVNWSRSVYINIWTKKSCTPLLGSRLVIHENASRCRWKCLLTELSLTEALLYVYIYIYIYLYIYIYGYMLTVKEVSANIDFFYSFIFSKANVQNFFWKDWGPFTSQLDAHPKVVMELMEIFQSTLSHFIIKV